MGILITVNMDQLTGTLSSLSVLGGQLSKLAENAARGRPRIRAKDPR